MSERRIQTTKKKHITLTPTGLAKIQTWADAQKLSFSAAIETLALLGLDDDQSDLIIPALKAVVRQSLALTFNRFAKLLSDIAIESATARTMSEAVFLQHIRVEAMNHPTDFQTKMRVRVDGQVPLDAGIRQFHEEVKAAAQASAIKRIKRSVSRLDELFEAVTDE
jgi:hypothetical protein